MPVRHARSETRGRPPCGRRGGIGNSGSTRAQRRPLDGDGACGHGILRACDDGHQEQNCEARDDGGTFLCTHMVGQG
jgi:hypothetical protein